MQTYMLVVVMTSFLPSAQSTSGIKSTLNFETNRQTPLLKDDERLTLNCSGILHKEETHPDNKAYYFRLSITDDKEKVLTQSDVFLSHDFEFSTYRWIVLEVRHEFYTSAKKFNCQWITNFTGFKDYLKSTSVVFANPPEAPVNISHVFFKTELLIFADSPYGKIAQDELGTTYSLRYRGDQCLNTAATYWKATKPCQVTYARNSKSMVTCLLTTLEYEKCQEIFTTVVIENRNSLGKSRSQLFHIRTERRNQPLSLQEKSYKRFHDKIAVELPDISALSPFHDVFYKVRFWPSNKNESSSKEIASVSNTISIPNLQPKQCYKMLARMEVNLDAGGRRMTKSSEKKTFCTSEQEHLPQNLTCEEIPKVNHDDVSTFKLEWNYPLFAFQGVTSFRLLTEVDGKQEVNSSIPFQNRSTHMVYSKATFKRNALISFILRSCNEDGCSQNFTSCQLLYKDLLADGEISAFKLDLFLSCIIPAAVIFFLVLAACWSYYTRKDLLAQFEELEPTETQDVEADHTSLSDEEKRTQSQSPTGTIATQVSCEKISPAVDKT